MNWNPMWSWYDFLFSNLFYLGAMGCFVWAICVRRTNLMNRFRLVCFAWLVMVLCYIWRLQYIMFAWPPDAPWMLATCMLRAFLQAFTPPFILTAALLISEAVVTHRCGRHPVWVRILYGVGVVVIALSVWFACSLITNCCNYKEEDSKMISMPDL